MKKTSQEGGFHPDFELDIPGIGLYNMGYTANPSSGYGVFIITCRGIVAK
jgi:hypothetical protein